MRINRSSTIQLFICCFAPFFHVPPPKMSLLKKTPLFCAKECATFLDLLRTQYSKESQIAASLYFRKKLAACQEPPAELVEAIINELVDCIQRQSGELQLNASWALTNLACGSRQQTHRIIASGGVGALMKLAKTATGEARDQAIWALGNLAADCGMCRESVRETGLIDLLIQLLELPDYQLHDSRKILIWCLANVLRGGINDLELENVGRLLNSLNSTISIFGQGGEILCDSIWCVAYLIDHQAVEGERIDMLLQQPALVANIVALLKSDSIRSLTGALRTIGNVITGTDEQTTAILDYGVLQDLSVLVNSGVHQISRECLWILSNIAAGTQEHVTRLFSIDGLAESVMRLCSDQSPRKRKESYWVMVNAMMGADSQMYEYLLGGGLAQILVQLLEENLDQALFDRAINTIWRSLQERPEHKNYTMALFRRVGLIEQILKIAQNTSNGNDHIAELAANLLHQHFGIHVIKRNAGLAATSTTNGGGGGGNNKCNKKKEKILVRIRKIDDC